jgi:hypothetical protein
MNMEKKMINQFEISFNEYLYNIFNLITQFHDH